MSRLPVPPTRFIGREAELAEAATLLAENRLLTLTGPGGGGKTRLAIHLASRFAEHFADGVWFVDLSSLSGGDFVWDRVALTLGVRDPGQGRTWADAIGHYLALRDALLVIDNCEHVVETAAEVVASILEAARRVKVVATSREPLGVSGEVTWAVPRLIESDAVDLFSDRARQASPRFALVEAERPAVLEICNRLDGMPLAIELAAARVRALAPARIAAGLKDRFAVLPSGPRTAPRRQSTLAASFDWSFDLLSEPERALLRQLSVFAGGFDVEAALAVCPAASVELLASLADRSLVVVEKRTGQAEPRYRLLETVRQFAAEHLEESEEVELMRNRHRDYYTVLAEKAEPGLTSADDARWETLLMAEQENLRAAMAWSRDRAEAEALARLLAPLGMLWTLSGRRGELMRWLDPALARAEDVSPRLRSRLILYECEMAAFDLSRMGDVPALAQESLALARLAGSKRDEAGALSFLTVLAGLLGDDEAMHQYADEAVRVGLEADFPYAVVSAREFVVLLRMFRSGPEENWRLVQEAIAVSKAIQRHTQLTVRSFAGMIALSRGRLAEAEEILAAVVEDGRGMTDFNYLHSLVDVGLVKMFRGDLDAARRLLGESLVAAERAEAEERTAGGVALHARLARGWIHLAKGESAEAPLAIAAVLNAMRSSLARPVLPLPLVLLADAYVSEGRFDEATSALVEATSLAESRQQTWFLGRASLVNAKLHLRRGDQSQAESLVHEAVKDSREADDQMALVDELELLAEIATRVESHLEAVRLWAAADTRRHELGYARFPSEVPRHDASIAAAKRALGAQEFADAEAEGAKLSIEDAIAYSARGRGERKRPSIGWASLTPTEVEVARLVGEHLSNPEIAARLFVSRATVKTHLVHIFAKLGIESRSELAAQEISRRQTSAS